MKNVKNINGDNVKHQIDMKKFNIHTDMAIDKINESAPGISTKIKIYGDIKITDIILDKENSINKKQGNYVTIEFADITDSENYNKVKEVFIKKLREILKKLKITKDKKGLIIGLGNENSTPDSLGAKVVNNILVTRHIARYAKLANDYMNISSIIPKVVAQTGIDSYEIIEAIVDKIKPDFLIVVDALVTNKTDRLLKTIQINDVGISAGSGVGKNYKEISFETLNIPVLAIGIPTVLSYDNLMVTTKEIDYEIEKLSMLISSSINDIVHK